MEFKIETQFFVFFKGVEWKHERGIADWDGLEIKSEWPNPDGYVSM